MTKTIKKETRTKSHQKEDYQKTSIGEVPSDWEVKQIGDIAFIDQENLSGAIPKNYSFNYISISDIEEGQMVSEPQKIEYKNAPSRAKRLVREGDILMATVRPNRKGIFIIRYDEKDLVASTGFAVISCTDCSNEFLYQFLFSTKITKQVSQIIAGSNYPAITSQDVKKLKIPLPSLPEQRRIAEILSTWDRAIERTQRLIDALEKRKKGLMQQLLTGKVRLKGFSGEWKFVQAGELFENISKKNIDGPLLSVTQENGVIPRHLLESKVTMPEGSTSSFKLVEKGNFIISLRSFQGGLENSKYRGLVSPAYTVLQAKKDICDGYYKFYFKTYHFIGHLASAVIGIRDGKQVSYEEFCRVKIPYPSLEEQQNIANLLNQVIKEINCENIRLVHLKDQKKGLMQQLLTGKKRINYKD